MLLQLRREIISRKSRAKEWYHNIPEQVQGRQHDHYLDWYRVATDSSKWAPPMLVRTVHVLFDISHMYSTHQLWSKVFTTLTTNHQPIRSASRWVHSTQILEQ